jgi:hypothetical protein
VQLIVNGCAADLFQKFDAIGFRRSSVLKPLTAIRADSGKILAELSLPGARMIFSEVPKRASESLKNPFVFYPDRESAPVYV